VPEVLAAYEKDGSFFLWMENPSGFGVRMAELSETDQAIVMKE